VTNEKRCRSSSKDPDALSDAFRFGPVATIVIAKRPVLGAPTGCLWRSSPPHAATVPARTNAAIANRQRMTLLPDDDL
jgi:hypothetical protein